MDYKYIEQLLERYFNAETSLEEESILRTFFSQTDVPAEMQQWRSLFTVENTEKLDDDFDARIMEMISNEEPHTVIARRVSITQRLMPLFKAAAVIAIFLTIGGALQAPWDNSWNTPDDYASLQQQMDTINYTPVQAENMVVGSADSTGVMLTDHPKD